MPFYHIDNFFKSHIYFKKFVWILYSVKDDYKIIFCLWTFPSCLGKIISSPHASVHVRIAWNVHENVNSWSLLTHPPAPHPN